MDTIITIPQICDCHHLSTPHLDALNLFFIIYSLIYIYSDYYSSQNLKPTTKRMTSQFFFPHQNKPLPDTTNYTILLGALSSGNLPQLSLQAIIQALPETHLFGIYHDPAAVEPFVTTAHLARAETDTTPLDKPPTIHFGIEFYINHTIKTIIVIQRSRIIEHRAFTFTKAFFQFVQSLSPSKCILLTSLGPSHRPAEHKDLIQFFTVEPSQDPENPDTKVTPSATILQTTLNLPPTHLTPDEIEADLQYLKIKYGEKNRKPCFFPYPIKGTGLTRQIAKFSRKNQLPLIGLVGFTGPDAASELGTTALQFIQSSDADLSKNWKLPTLTSPPLEEYC